MIQQALLMGHTVSQVLNFITTKIPNMASGVTNAKKRGYSDDDILKFLSGKIKVDKQAAEKKLSETEEVFKLAGLKNKAERQNDKAKFLKGALGAAGTALAAYNMYQGYKGIFSGQGLPPLSQRGQGGPQIGPQPGTPPMPGQPNQPISPNQPQNPPVSSQNGPSQGQTQTNMYKIGANQQPPAGIPQPKTPKLTPFQQQQSQMPHDPKKILDDMGLTQSIENLKEAGNEPQAIKAAIEHQVKPFQRDWLRKQTGLDVGEVVERYLQNPAPNENIEGQQQPNASEQNQQQDNAQNDLQPTGVLNQENPPQEQIIEQLPEQTSKQKSEKPPLEKGSTVITPDGDFGKVEDLPGKTAKIDVDGKKRIIDTEDAIQIPENEDELLDLYERLIAKLPEEYKSGPLNWVGYDPERNLMSVKFHNGDQYTYEDIPPEFVERIRKADFLAKTTGNNYYGAWEQGKSSRGAGIYALIQDLQKHYGGKGKEYTAKFKQVYSYFEHPEKLLKEKQNRQKELAKEQKKNEREEKKKRKGTA